MQQKEWVYKSTAKAMFKLTDNQIREAITHNLVTVKTVPNPHYTSAPPSMLLKLDDLKMNLEQIKAFPKFSKDELNRRKLYAKRSKTRDKLEFYCPRCRQKIRALKGSQMFEEAFKGKVSIEEAKKVLMIAHYRHQHTEYDYELSMVGAERYERYLELRDEGYDFDTAWMIVDDEIPDKTDVEKEELKKRFNKEAVELLKKDGLLPNA